MNDGHHGYDPSAPLPLLPGHSSGGRLERVLRLGRFAVTAELNPPDSADPRDVYERALVLSEVCDAINAFERDLRSRLPEVKWCFVEPDVEA